MNLGTARTELLARGADYLSSTRANQFLNAAIDRLNGTADWPFLETTVTGTAPLTIANVRRVLSVSDTTNGSSLQGVDGRTVSTFDPRGTLTGVGWYYWIDGQTTLRVYPTNTTATLSVRYIKNGATLSLDADTPDLPARYHATLWIDQAMVYVYKDSDNFEAAASLQADLDRAVFDAVREEMGRVGSGPEFIEIRSSTDW